jgi:hypothetical protein
MVEPVMVSVPVLLIPPPWELEAVLPEMVEFVMVSVPSLLIPPAPPLEVWPDRATSTRLSVALALMYTPPARLALWPSLIVSLLIETLALDATSKTRVALLPLMLSAFWLGPVIVRSPKTSSSLPPSVIVVALRDEANVIASASELALHAPIALAQREIPGAVIAIKRIGVRIHHQREGLALIRADVDARAARKRPASLIAREVRLIQARAQRRAARLQPHGSGGPAIIGQGGEKRVNADEVAIDAVGQAAGMGRILDQVVGGARAEGVAKQIAAGVSSDEGAEHDERTVGNMDATVAEVASDGAVADGHGFECVQEQAATLTTRLGCIARDG